MKRFIPLAISLALVQFSLAQNELSSSDVLRYSQLTFGGDARYCSMAGAFGALGADFSTLSSNPAGIGLYRKDDIVFTPSIYTQTTKSDYLSQTGVTNTMNFYVGNAGIVLTSKTHKAPEQKGWEFFSFGFGYNRTADFTGGYTIQGTSTNSLTSVYLHNANGISSNNTSTNLDPFNEQLAYNTYLIDNPSVANQYTTYLPVSGGVTQNQSTQTSGGSGETVLTFGGNYNDKVYVGFTLGIPHINYSNTTIYTEKANDTVSGGINSFSLNHQLTTTGIGVDFKMGLIYRVFDWMRLGFAYHSPTYYSMHDDYSSSITTNFTNNTYTSSSPSGANNYQLITPSRVIGSVGFVVAQRGLIGLDYEYINYAQSSVSGGIPSFDNSSPNGNFNSINTSITQQYQAASNIRLGLEWRLDENITIRGGYAIYGNPYQSSANIDASRDSYTAGIGFRTRVFYCDLAYVLTQYKENYYMFNPSYSNLSPVTNSFSGSSAMMTFGFKF